MLACTITIDHTEILILDFPRFHSSVRHFPRISDRDGQTNVKKNFPFVCPSSIPTTKPRARARLPRISDRDGQTNVKKIIPFVVIYPYNYTARPRAFARLGSVIETDRRMLKKIHSSVRHISLQPHQAPTLARLLDQSSSIT